MLSALKSVILTNFQNDLNVFDEMMSEMMSFNAFLTLRFLFNSLLSCTSTNRKTVNLCIYILILLLFFFSFSR